MVQGPHTGRTSFAGVLILATITYAKRSEIMAHVHQGHAQEKFLPGLSGGKEYPKADDYYPDDWQNTGSLGRVGEALKDLQADANDTGISDEEKAEALMLTWTLAMHGLFNAMQGQGCSSLCAVCLPRPENVDPDGDLELKSISIRRAKNLKDGLIAGVTIPVDTILGGAVGSLAALPVAVAGLFAGGIAAGAAAGEAVAASSSNVTGSFAGNILGLVAGVTTGSITGVMLAVAAEVLGVGAGFWKGVGITAANTKCKRVGFSQSSGGKKDTEKRFNSIDWNENYGLKRLRKWMDENAPANATSGEEVATAEQAQRANQFAQDSNAIGHCERLRDHTFDMRHAGECIRHSQLCGSGGGVIVPSNSNTQCRKYSDLSYLEELAVMFGDDNKTGMFAQWRAFQEMAKDGWGYDGKKRQCIKTLCKYGGYKKAARKLHPDKVRNMDIDEDEKEVLINVMTFLNQCKAEEAYEVSQGQPLTLNDPAEREAFCKAVWEQENNDASE